MRTGERNINNLHHADDTTLIVENLEDLKALIWKFKEQSKKMGFQLNMKKTKVMTTELYHCWTRCENGGQLLHTLINY